MVWFLAILFTVPTFYIIQIYWRKNSLKEVVFERKFDKRVVFPGDSFYMDVSLTNYKLLPLPWIKITSDIPEAFQILGQKIYKAKEKLSNEHTIITSLKSYEKLTRIHEIKVNQRGYYSMLDVKISTGDYYGFLKSEKNIHLPIDLLVYPEIKPIQKLITIPVKPYGKWNVKRWLYPDLMDIIGSRDYTANESFSDIDWIATSKLNKLQVKQYDYNAKNSVMIFLDIRTHTNDWKFKDFEIVEKGIEICAGLTEVFHQEKVDVGFATNSKLLGGNNQYMILPRNGLKQKMLILDTLARMSYYKKQDFSEFIHFNGKKLNKNDVIVYITPYLNEETKSHLNRLKSKGFACKIIYLKEKQSGDELGLMGEIEILYMNRGDANA